MKTLKKITLFIFLLANVMCLQAQELERFSENNKYGFKDANDKIVIPAKYDYAWNFEEGVELVEVKLNKKYGYIDRTGKEVIPVIYDEINSIEGFELIEVKLNDKYGCVDKTGKVVIPIVYDDVRISDGFVIVENNAKYALMDKNGSKIIDFKYEDLYIMSSNEIRVVLNDKYGLITFEDKVIIPFEYSYLLPYTDTTYLATKDDYENWGLINTENKIILPFKYYWEAGKCCDKLQPVMMKSTKKWTFSDPKGKFLTDFKYDWTGHFMGNIAPVELNRKFGFVNKKGLELCPPRYDHFGYYNDSIGLIPVNVGAISKIIKEEDGYEWRETKGGKWGFINQQGKEVISVKYDSVELFSDGMALVKYQGKWGIIDEVGKVITPFNYQSISNMKGGGSGSHKTNSYEITVNYATYRTFQQNNKIGLATVSGELIGACIYDEINLNYNNYHGSIFFTKKDGKFGLINLETKVIIEPKYSKLEGLSFDETSKKIFTNVELDNKYGIIDIDGKEIIPVIYDERFWFDDELAKVKLNDKYGFIDKTGKEVIPIIYDKAGFFYNGKAEVTLNGRTFYIDKNGNEIKE